MSELVERLINNGNIFDAYLVIKNYLSKDMANKEVFKEYIDLAMEIVSYNILYEERLEYLQDANTALEMFSESVEMDEDSLILIKDTRSRINKAYTEIINSQSEYNEKKKREIQEANNKLMKELNNLYSELVISKGQEGFDEILSKVSDIDSKVNKEELSSTQQKSYEKLTKSFSQAISSKMEELNRLSLMEYNKKAIRSLDEVFKIFTNDEKKKMYKSESTLKNLMVSKFFVYDTSKLFNESLVFYNHVYSLVFQAVDNNLKYKLTEWAVNTSKV